MGEQFLKFDYDAFNDTQILKILSRYGDPKRLKVLYLSTYLPNYTRTEALLDILDRNGVKYRAILTGNSWLKYISAVYHAVKLRNDFDLVLLAFRGHETLPLIRPFIRKPIIFDAFLSMYDTLCSDRKIFSPHSMIGKAIHSYEKFLIELSDITLVDTKTHKDYFCATFGMCDKIDYLYVGCNKRLFNLSAPQNNGSGAFSVFWHGSALPLHGVDVILRAAKLLEGRGILFRMAGPIGKKYGRLIEELGLSDLDLLGYVQYERLPALISGADLCLGGHFADIDKAGRVIAGKTFQYLACGKTVIIGDNPADRELFEESDRIRFVKMNSPQALAELIMEIFNSKR